MGVRYGGVSMIGKVRKSGGSGGIKVENGAIQQYLSYLETIEPNTFVEFIDDNGITKIKVAETKFDGLTKTKATTTSAGKVWVLNS